MTGTIKKFEQENNILIGVCDNGILEYTNDKPVPFVNYSLDERTNPLLAFEKTKSIIVIAVPYGKLLNFKTDNEIRGRISVSAIGEDYHTATREVLENLMGKLNAAQKIEYKIFVDNGPLIERELAKKSGIGCQGRNRNIITEKFGSFVFLGYALVDVFIPPAEKILTCGCGGCSLCVEACPTGALKSADVYKCVSYLTQSKTEIPDGLKKNMCGYIYGCDICQSVCPKNIGKHTSEINDIDTAMPKVEFLKSLSNKEFKALYGKSAMYWRGKKTILRNAEIAEKYFYGKV